jgi:hypothetical protein
MERLGDLTITGGILHSELTTVPVSIRTTISFVPDREIEAIRPDPER